MFVFRVSFSGPDLDQEAIDALSSVGARWESSWHEPHGPSHHLTLAGASSDQEALRLLAGALAAYASFSDFHAAPVIDRSGQIKHTPIRSLWEEIDWDEVERKAPLSDLERQLLGCLLNSAEPTWILFADEQIPNDRDEVEAALRGLEERRLLYSTLELSGEPDRPPEMGRWWALTEETWDLLGLIEPHGYH